MNELIIVDKIEKRLQAKREPIIFPLSPTHRRELRDLRDSNIGNLRDRLSTIRQLKEEEYVNKYSNDIKKELLSRKQTVIDLNKNWDEIVKKINVIVQERKVLENKLNVKGLNLDKSYNDFSNLEKLNPRRTFDLNEDIISKEIAQNEFESKFGKQFEQVQKNINDIVTKYEEAINFGDLEIVKELYYIMKKADCFFEKVSDLEI